MKSYRKAQHRFTEVSKDIVVGFATVVAVEIRGIPGWTLPGRKFTTDRDRAIEVCEQMNEMIQGLGGLKFAEKQKKAA